jgi:hypothetical protein
MQSAGTSLRARHGAEVDGKARAAYAKADRQRDAANGFAKEWMAVRQFGWDQLQR